MISDETKKKNKMEEYERREIYWSEQSLNQLGYSINIFFTIGIGLLAYLIGQRDGYPKLYFVKGGAIDWSLAIYLLVILMTFLSTILGVVAIISRLNDLRITRHITYVRRKVLEQHNLYLPDDFQNFKRFDKIMSLIDTTFKPIRFIKFDGEFNYSRVYADFNLLRLQCKLLGQLTWQTHKWQIAMLFASTVILGITVLVF